MTIDRAKWNGKDWRSFTCVGCGYSKGDKSWCIKHNHGFGLDNRACPDFELRKLLDPLTYDPEATDDTGGP